MVFNFEVAGLFCPSRGADEILSQNERVALIVNDLLKFPGRIFRSRETNP
jgi:hypothetical protein